MIVYSAEPVCSTLAIEDRVAAERPKVLPVARLRRLHWTADKQSLAVAMRRPPASGCSCLGKTPRAMEGNPCGRAAARLAASA
jgi:hypothetical protein